LKVGHRLLNGDQIISALVQYKLLESLVGQLLLDEAIKEVTLTKQEVFHILAGVRDVPVPDDFEGFVAQWCQYKQVTPEYFNQVVLRELRVEKFKQLYFANQVESEFLRIKSDLDQVEYSLIQLHDLSLAQELYFQLRDDGADFAQLARQYSSGSEREMGGRIGPVSLSSLPDEIATLFCSAQVGALYGPVPIADIFWIVRLEQFTSARLTEATRANLIHRMYHQWLQTQVRKVLNTPGMIAVQPEEECGGKDDAF
jgi:parvulin-like peptidyl-prolyl isomerase